MNCRYCGTDLPPGAMFCGECGRAVQAPEPVASPRVVAPTPAVVEPPYAALGGAAPLAFSSAGAASDDPVDHIAPAARASATCLQCGATVEDDEVFCGECGFVLRSVPPPPASGPPPVDDVPIDAAPDDVSEFDVAALDVGGLDAEALDVGTLDGGALDAGALDGGALDVGALDGALAPAHLPDMSATDLVPALEPDLELSIERAPRPDPFPWGLQRAPVEDIDVEDLEATRMSADPFAGQRFVLQFSTGENVTIAGAGLVGRNPIAQPGEFVDQLVAIFDPTKSVSKTHLEFGQEAGRFWVTDRFSTNGSVVRQPAAEPKRCDPGKRYFVARGTRVDIGEQFFVIS